MAAIIPALEGLDKSLVNMSFWIYAKHVARFWMAYTNIANHVYTHTKGIAYLRYYTRAGKNEADSVEQIRWVHVFDDNQRIIFVSSP